MKLLILAGLLSTLMLAGCGDKNDPAHYSSTGIFSLSTPACNGGDVCRGGN